MYVHVPAAWMASLVYAVVAASSAVALIWRHPLGRHRGAGGGAAGRGLHPDLPRLRLALGRADVGHLVGVGRAAHLGAGAVLSLSRLHRAGERLRRSDARRQGRARSWRWSAWSTCRSSNSRSIGGARCTSRRASSASAARPSRPSMLWPFGVMALGFTLFFATLLLVRMRSGAARRQDPRAAPRGVMAGIGHFLAMGGYAIFVWPAYRGRGRDHGAGWRFRVSRLIAAASANWRGSSATARAMTRKRRRLVYRPGGAGDARRRRGARAERA